MNKDYNSVSDKDMVYQKFYNDIYKSQDLSNELYIETAKWKAENLVSLVPSRFSFNRILEIGCGAGLLLEEIYKITGCRNIYGMDISEVAIKKAKFLLPFGKFEVKTADKLGYPNNFFDVLILCDILEHLEDLEALMPKLLKYAKYTLLKIPIEDALALNIMYKVRGVAVGLETSKSGHLYRWSVKSALRLIRSVNDIEILHFRFEPFLYKFSTHKMLIKNIFVSSIQFLDKWTKTRFLSEKIIGGSLFVFCQNKE